MRTITRINRNDNNVWVSDDNGNMVPGIEFSFEIKKEFTTDEIYIYYNTIDKTWFGEHISYGDWVDIPEDVLQGYIDKYELRAQIYDK